MAFAGFPADTITFLEELAGNNDRTWFKAREKRYQAAIKGPLADLCTAVDDRAAAEELTIAGDAKRSPFRIHRDIRFSPDKRPYKTHLGIYFGPSGSRKEAGGVYLHVDPLGSFIAAGIYQPDSQALAQIRRSIADNPGRFTAMVEAMAVKGLELSPGTEKLQRMPPAFADHKDAPFADYLLWKRFLTHRPVDRAVVESPALVDAIAAMARDTADFRAWAVDVQVPRADKG